MTIRKLHHSNQTTDAASRIDQWREDFESKLSATLELRPYTPGKLHDAMRYSALAGGKRLRPLLVYGACDALEVQTESLDGVACAIELIHAYSLIHDDLPAMDDDDLRRGRPTCHRAFDEATAILAGDALQALAFELLASDQSLMAYPERQVAIIRQIAQACGEAGMAGGQSLDLDAVGMEITISELTHMHRLKTGALIKVCATAPALFASANPELSGKLERYGACVGLAFQIFDDILDVTGCAKLTGKSTQKDAIREKPTFPGLLGIEGSRKQAMKLRDEAMSHLTGFPGNCDALAELAAVAVDREN